MKKFKKTALIIIAVALVLFTAFKFLAHWLEDYSVDMTGESGIPAPAATLPDVRPDSLGWPCWKGINHDNRSPFTDIITDWSAGLELRWAADYFCRGDESVTWSCPVISGNHLVIPGRHDSTDIIFCLNPQSGTLLWQHSFLAPADNASYGEGPRATPTIDGDRVYVLSRGGILKCLNLQNGTEVWKRQYTDMGAKEPIWGFSGSPYVYGNTLIVFAGGTSLAYGLDKMTGATVWQSAPAPVSYSTPAVITHAGEPLLLALGGQTFFGLNPQDGTTRWKLPRKVPNSINVCTPLYSAEHGITVISAWYKKGTQGIQIGSDKAEVRWHSDALNAHQTDPVILGDHIYGFSGMSGHNKDDFVCLDLLTGEEKWRSPELGSGQFIIVGSYILSLDIKGTLSLSQVSPAGLEAVSRIEDLISTDNARLWTKPIAAQGNLYLRYANRLYCYRLAK